MISAASAKACRGSAESEYRKNWTEEDDDDDTAGETNKGTGRRSV